MAEEDAPRALRPGGRDYLVPIAQAAATLGRSPETLASWHEKGLIPLVELDGDRRSTFASWLAALMNSPRPGHPGNLAAVAEAWWAEHKAAAPARKAVA